MSAEVLRQAAALMRERAEARGVPAGPWFVEDDGRDFNVLAPDPTMPSMPWDVARDVPSVGPDDDQSPIAEHIASWHPAVALAVADWLDEVSSDFRMAEQCEHSALAVARAYLGEA